MDCIRAFELEQMSYSVLSCSVCHEARIDMKMFNENTCFRCHKDKSHIKMLSSENNMNPGKVPNVLSDLSIVEQQLICRIAPCINVHLLKHGGIGSSGHCRSQ